MPLTNLDEKQGCRMTLWLVGGAVGVLLLLSLLPIHSHVHPHGPPQRVMSEMKSLEMAVKGYQTEYNRLPSSQSPPPVADNAAGYDTTSDEGKRIIEILAGTDTQKNPRGIGFYEPPVSKGDRGYTKARGLVDAWGARGYIMIFDYDGDKKIADPEHPGATIATSVIVYSAGPDGDFNTWKDNVKSWE